MVQLPESPVTIPRIINPSLRSSAFKECFTAKEARPQLQRGSEKVERGTVGEESTKADTRKVEWPIFLLGMSLIPKSEAQDVPKSKGFFEH